MLIQFNKTAAPAAGNRHGAMMEIVKPINNTDSETMQPSPLAADIKSCATALGQLAGRVDHEQWLLLRNVRINLFALADYAKEIEQNLVVYHE